MNRLAQILFGSGCLVSLAAPIAGAVLYPRAKWLFVLMLAGILLIILSTRFRHDPEPQAVAEFIERLLSGSYGGWDVDDYEHLNPRNASVRELWHESMEVGGLPEEWMGRDEETRKRLHNIAQKLRQLEDR